MNPLYVVLQGHSDAVRLLPGEIDLVFEFAFRMHNHDASTPAQPLFWVPSESNEIWKFTN